MSVTVLRIAVAGAQGTGKTSLCQALRTALPADLDCCEWTTPQQIVKTPDTLVLLTGLDLALPNAIQQSQDAAWRHALASTGYQVIYGQAEARTRNALHAIARELTARDQALTTAWLREAPPARWQGVCESCSDPDCEHRLFARLLAR